MHAYGLSAELFLMGALVFGAASHVVLAIEFTSLSFKRASEWDIVTSSTHDYTEGLYVEDNL